MKSQTTHVAIVPGGPRAKTLRDISQKLFYGSCFCQFALVFTVSYEVVSRGIFGIPTMWSFDISSYLMLLIIFLGVAYVFVLALVELLLYRLCGFSRAGAFALGRYRRCFRKLEWKTCH